MIFKTLHLFAGLGGGALGFQRARGTWLGHSAGFRTLAGVDVDPAACADFRALTGAPATCADLATMTPAELLVACRGEAPDVVFTSPPCKGFSGLLPREQAESEKYQALNRLVYQGLGLVLATFAHRPPKLILLENVPRITSRGADLLRQVRDLLLLHGYRTHEGFHDCGELGGLGQHRRRFLLIARHEAQVPTLVYAPPRRAVRTIGDVLGPLPMPDDPAGGPLHRVPRLKWKTWVRLALIPAGGDWRALGVRREGAFNNTYRIVPWADPAGAVTAGSGPSSSGTCVADPRLSDAPGRHHSKWRVERWDDAAHTVAGSDRVGSGAPSIGDPRLGVSEAAHRNLYRVEAWGSPGHTVTGAVHTTGGAPSVADPRVDSAYNNGTYGVLPWDGPIGTVTGRGSPSTGAFTLADPRIAGKGSRPDLFGVLRWDGPAKTISGQASVSGSNCPAAVADPRVPSDDDRPDPVPVIVALDGTWHRPLTTLELAALQGLPTTMADGSPLMLAGKNHGGWRERIGNAVPPPAAQAIGEAVLDALCASAAGATFRLGGGDIWVSEQLEGAS